MPEFPAMPFWFSDYFNDTKHLTNEEHGLYLKLLGLLWQSPGARIPNDRKWIKRRFNSDSPIILSLIKEFCQCDGNWITQSKLLSEFIYVAQRVERQRERANARWHKEKDLCHGITTAYATAMPPTLTLTPTQVRKKDSCSSSDERFRIFWEKYPRKVGKKAAEKAFKKAIREASLESILSALTIDIGNWKEEQFTPHPTTWLNQGRYLDHQSTPAKAFYRPLVKGNGHADQRQDLKKSTAKTAVLLDEGPGFRDEDAT